MRIYGVTRYFFRWPIQGMKSKSPHWERRGRSYWPEFSACYMIAAQKRVRTMTPVRPVWSSKAKVVGGLVEPSARVSKLPTNPNR